MYFTNKRYFSRGNSLLPIEEAGRDRQSRQQASGVARQSKKSKKRTKKKKMVNSQSVNAKRNRGNVNSININVGGGGGGGFRGGGGSSSSSTSFVPQQTQSRSVDPRGLEEVLNRLTRMEARQQPAQAQSTPAPRPSPAAPAAPAAPVAPVAPAKEKEKEKRKKKKREDAPQADLGEIGRHLRGVLKEVPKYVPAPAPEPRPAPGPIPFTGEQMDFPEQDGSRRRAEMRSRLRELRESAEIEKGLRQGEDEERRQRQTIQQERRGMEDADVDGDSYELSKRQRQTIPTANNWSQQDRRDMATATIGKFEQQYGFKKLEAGKGSEDWEAKAARAEAAEASRAEAVAQQRAAKQQEPTQQVPAQQESIGYYPGDFFPAADAPTSFTPKGASKEPDLVDLMHAMEAEEEKSRSAAQDNRFERKQAKKAQKERRREGAAKKAAEAVIRSAQLKAKWEQQQAMERALQDKAPSAATSVKDKRVEKALAVTPQPSPQQAPAATPVRERTKGFSIHKAITKSRRDQPVVLNQKKEERPRKAQLSLGDASPRSVMTFTAEKDPMATPPEWKKAKEKKFVKIADATKRVEQRLTAKRARPQIRAAESRQLAIQNARAELPMASPAEQAQAHGPDLRGLQASIAARPVTVPEVTMGEHKRDRGGNPNLPPDRPPRRAPRLEIEAPPTPPVPERDETPEIENLPIPEIEDAPDDLDDLD